MIDAEGLMKLWGTKGQGTFRRHGLEIDKRRLTRMPGEYCRRGRLGVAHREKRQVYRRMAFPSVI